MYAGDAEWGPDGEFLCCSFYGAPDGKRPKLTFIERGKPYDGPTYIDDVMYYYIAPRDIALIEQFVKFREYRDLNVLISIRNNYCSGKEERKGKKGLKAAVEKYCGIKMLYKKIEFDKLTKVTKKLRLHNKEDSRCTYELVKYFLNPLVTTEEERTTAARFEELNKPWRTVAEQWLYYDVEWQNALISTENLLKRCNEQGIDFFEAEGERFHIRREKFQKWLEHNNVPVPTHVSSAPYAKDGLLREMHWTEFEDLGRTAKDPELRLKCSLIHLALRAHVAETGQKRFGSERFYVTEALCSQSSGRISHLGDPVTAGILFRMAVRPPPGYKTLSLDIKSQEIVLAALFSEDEELRKACTSFKDKSKKSPDFYSFVSAKFTDSEYRKLDKNDPRRVVAKNIALPWLYGIGAKKLSTQTLCCELSYAQMVLDRLDRMFPDFRHWKDDVESAVTTEGVAITALHKFPLKIDEAVIKPNPKQAINHVIQGTGCDMLREWVKVLVEVGYPPFSTLHDGCYVFVPEEFDEQVLIDASEKCFNDLLPLWEGASWKVECSTYRGHLMEKGKDYFKLVASLRGEKCWVRIAMEEPVADWEAWAGKCVEADDPCEVCPHAFR